MSTTSEDTPKRMGKSKKGDRLDASHFQAPGLNYKGKFIGVEDVPGPRGDKMCHVAMAKLKAAVKTIGEHKLKIIVNISLDGIRIVEEKSETLIFFHPVQRISFISRDPGDSRAFGYVYGREDGAHQFYGIKTEKVAENIVLNLRDLFQIVFEMKQQEDGSKEDMKMSQVQQCASASSARKGYNNKNGLDQLNVYSSSWMTYSSGLMMSSRMNSPGGGHMTVGSTTYSPIYQDRKMAALQDSGHQRSLLSHHASEAKHSPLATKQMLFAAKQYSSMTLPDHHHQHHYQRGISASAVTGQPSTYEMTVSPQSRVRSQLSSIQSPEWFPVALPPPSSTGAGSVSGRHHANGYSGCQTDSSSNMSEGWAVFETLGEAAEKDGSEIEIGKSDSSEHDASTGDKMISTSECSLGYLDGKRPSVEISGVVGSEVGEHLMISGVASGVETQKGLSPKVSSSLQSSASPKYFNTSGNFGTCIVYSHIEGSCVTSKSVSVSAVPTLASPESLSDEEESSPEDICSLPSPDTPPPPLPLDMVIDLTLEPPVPPPRPKPMDTTIRRSAETTESPIYGNLEMCESAMQTCFTLPRPDQSQSLKPRPIQVGYDLTMPRPRPIAYHDNHGPHDDLELNKERTFARRPFQRGKTLSSCQQEELNEFLSTDSVNPVLRECPKNANGRVSESKASAANDPFAICLVSKQPKPQTYSSRSTAAEDGLIRTSISQIPRPRPRQRPTLSAARETSGVETLSNSRSKQNNQQSSPLHPANVHSDQAIKSRLNHLDSNRTQNKSEFLGNTMAFYPRKAESLSSERIAKAPEKVHKWSLDSSRSDTGPDPFIQVDPFATESFSDDPFSSQPDPLSLESPSSDPFSREFPKKTSAFCTRAVTVEMGDVFDDTVPAEQEDSAVRTTKVSDDAIKNCHVVDGGNSLIPGGNHGEQTGNGVQTVGKRSVLSLEGYGQDNSAMGLDPVRRLSLKDLQKNENAIFEGDVVWKNFEDNSTKQPRRWQNDGGNFADISSFEVQPIGQNSTSGFCLEPETYRTENRVADVNVIEGFADSFNPVQPRQSQDLS